MISAFNLKIFFDDVEPIGIVRMIIQGTTDSFIGEASDAGGKILKKEATFNDKRGKFQNPVISRKRPLHALQYH